MRTIAVDTETFLFGPENLAPRLVCLTYAFRRNKEVESYITSNGDGDQLYDDLVDLFEPGHRLVFHNAPYDLAVICENFPDLEPMIWAKLEAKEITDTMTREMLLNLSIHGEVDELQLEDGGNRRISYRLSDLVLEYMGIDLSDTKAGDDVWRMRYNELDGKPARRYPKEAAEYAKDDAVYTLKVYEQQCEMRDSEDGYASYGTAWFHTMAGLALYFISMRGMAVDEKRFYWMQEWLNQQLSTERLAKLITEGIMEPARDEAVYAAQAPKAAALIHAHHEAKLHTVTIVRRGNPVDIEVLEDEGLYLKYREFLGEHGVKFSKAKKSKLNTKPIAERIEAVSKEMGLKIKRTPTGEVSASDDVLSSLAPFDDVLKVLQHRQSLQKLVTTEMPRLMWPPFSDKPAKTVHFKFSALKNTGRTGSYGNDMKKAKGNPEGVAYPAAPGQQFHPAIRPCYTARPGFALVSIDFTSMELATTAQATLDLFGYSVHADKMIAGYDLHAYLASQLALAMCPEFVIACENAGFDVGDADEIYNYFVSLKPDKKVWKTDKKGPKTFYKWWRDFAKPVGLGYPGGLGPATFIAISLSTYRVDLYEIAEERFEEHPEEFDEEVWIKRLMRHGAKLHGWKDAVDFEWTKTMKAFALAMRLKDIWLETYPEMVEYFKWVQKQRDSHNSVLGTVTVEDIDGQEHEREVNGLCYTSPMGMHRAACKFTEIANGFCMQTPGAEGAKMSLIDVVRETRNPDSVLIGCYVVDFIHDELLVEVPLATSDVTVPEIQRLMSVGFSKYVLRDIPIGTEAIMMIQWRKEAYDVYDDAGRLIPWYPDEQEELQEQEVAASS